jgi:hypothetical protein
MNKLIGSIALVALAFSSCQKSETNTADAENEPPRVEATPAPAAPEATPVAKAIPAPTPAPELAPPGRYFLRRKASIETSEGIVGLPPGTPLDQTAPGQYRTLEGAAVAVSDSDVTNVMNEARALASQDRATQAALARSVAPKPAARATPARTRASAPAAAAPTPDTQFAEFQRKEQVLVEALEHIDVEMSKLTNPDPRRSPAAERLTKERNRLEAQRRTLRGQR